RYLQTRLPGYTPERHLGGARYLFIRGVRPGWQIDDAPAGIFPLPPNPDLLREMEAMLLET
ncbi:MAG: hypothetical protein LBB55_02025, partial [Zoogloeaceae bacterium]|nr:hypothetical protein [Zoogloeaceae bacterium]